MSSPQDADLGDPWPQLGENHLLARPTVVADGWVKLEQPAEIKAALPEARKAFETCKKAGDSFTLRKIDLTGPTLFQKYSDNVKRMLEEATEDDDRKAIATTYEKVTDDLQKFLADVSKALGGDAK